MIYNIDEHIGKQIRLKRKSKRISQASLGKIINVSFQQIQKYEKGLNKISAHNLYEVSKALETNINSFFEDINTKAPSNLLAEEQANFDYSIQNNNSEDWELVISRLKGTKTEEVLLLFLKTILKC